MEELRLALLKDNNSKRIRGLICELKKEDVYDEFCEFFEKCKVLHMDIADPVRQFVVEFIIKHRREYIPPTREEDELSIEGRVELVKEILEENLKVFNDPVEDKKIHLLMFLARIMNELRFPDKQENKKRSKQEKIAKEQKSKEKENEQKGKKGSLRNVWEKLRFLLCVFVAIKSDGKHTKYPIIDFYFQLLVDEEIILNLLKTLLEVLKNGSIYEEWADLETVYKSTRRYYELRKICIHLNHIESTKFDEYSNHEMIFFRHFQQIGESLTVIEKLRIEKEKSQIMTNYDGFLLNETVNNILSMRNQLSHAKANQGELLNFSLKTDLEIIFPKMYAYVFEMIKDEQISILDIFIDKWIAETDNKKLKTKMELINTAEINNWSDKTDEAKMKWVSKFVKKYSTNLRNILQTWFSEKQVNNLVDFISKHFSYKYKSINIINFYSHLKNLEVDNIKIKLKYLKDQKTRLAGDAYMNTMFSFSNAGIHTHPQNILTRYGIMNIKPTDFISQFSENVINNTNPKSQLFVKAVNKSENKIENVLEIILNAIDNFEEKQKFKELRKNLLFKRNLHQIFKTTGDSQYIEINWPTNDGIKVSEIHKYEDPLNCIAKQSNELLSDFKVVECFLNLLERRRLIVFKNKLEIVEKVKEMEAIGLRNRLQSIKRELEESKSNRYAKEMSVLDGFEVLKFLDKELVMEPNYMDFHCILPTGRALRNYLAHGDIYLDLFLTEEDRQTILDQQLEGIFEQQLNHPVPRKVYKSYLKKRFNLEQSWIEIFIVPFKLSPELRYPSAHIPSQEDFALAMRVRDVQGRSYVHHNLEKCDLNNTFFMYLVQFFKNKNLRKQCETLGEVNDHLLDSNRENQNKILEKMIKESKSPKESWSLTTLENGSTLRDNIIEEFINETDSKKKQILLCKIVSINCPKLDVYQLIFAGLEAHYESVLYLACLYNQLEIVEYIFDRFTITKKSIKLSLMAAVSGNSVQSAEYLLKKGAPIDDKILTAVLSNPSFEMIKLLLQYGAKFDLTIFKGLSFFLLSDPNFFEYVFEKCPDLMQDQFSLTSWACVWKSERLLKFLVEKGANVNAAYAKVSVLSVACFCFDDWKIVKYLLEKGANINSNVLVTPLAVACYFGKVEIGKYLMNNGADLSPKSNVYSPFHDAIRCQSKELVDEFFKRGIKINEKFVGYMEPITPKFFNYLVRKDSNINWVIKSLGKFFVLSTNIDLCNEMLNYLKDKKFHLSAYEFLVVLNNDFFYIFLKYPYQRLTENDWSLLLLESVYHKDFNKIRVIISKGANINYTDKNNRNCLHGLFSNYNCFDNSILRYLLINGADFTTEDEDQLTPIQIAARELDEHTFQGVLKIILESRDVKIKIQLPSIGYFDFIRRMKYNKWFRQIYVIRAIKLFIFYFLLPYIKHLPLIILFMLFYKIGRSIIYVNEMPITILFIISFLLIKKHSLRGHVGGGQIFRDWTIDTNDLYRALKAKIDKY